MNSTVALCPGLKQLKNGRFRLNPRKAQWVKVGIIATLRTKDGTWVQIGNRLWKGVPKPVLERILDIEKGFYRFYGERAIEIGKTKNIDGLKIRYDASIKMHGIRLSDIKHREEVIKILKGQWASAAYEFEARNLLLEKIKEAFTAHVTGILSRELPLSCYKVELHYSDL